MLPLLKSLFYSPYVKSCQTNNGTIALEIYCRNKRCGYINITNERVTSLISLGIKSFKGSTKREDTYFRYLHQKLAIINKATSKIILRIKCNKRMFNRIKHEFDTLKYTL